MSIYVSICCIGLDTELVKSVEDCKEMAAFSDDVYFGIAYTGEESFFEELKKDLSHIKNIVFKFTPVENNLGIARGRIDAASLYSNQDYFLQIDPHSRFTKNWDVFLVNQFNAATQIVNNEKTVISGYLPAYFYKEDDFDYEYIEDTLLRYNVWIPDNFILEDTIPKWTDDKPESVSYELDNIIKKTGFAPASKIVAMFMFGNHHLANNLSIPENLLFWEEEIIQSIELIDNGFSLVYPGKIAPIYHFYHNRIIDERGKRDGYKTFLKTEKNIEIYNKQMRKNFIDYINNKSNKKKILAFEKYNNIVLKDGAKNKTTFPRKYINMLNIPVI